jgi:hypothetical protein
MVGEAAEHRQPDHVLVEPADPLQVHSRSRHTRRCEHHRDALLPGVRFPSASLSHSGPLAERRGVRRSWHRGQGRHSGYAVILARLAARVSSNNRDRHGPSRRRPRRTERLEPSFGASTPSTISVIAQRRHATRADTQRRTPTMWRRKVIGAALVEYGQRVRSLPSPRRDGATHSTRDGRERRLLRDEPAPRTRGARRDATPPPPCRR